MSEINLCYKAYSWKLSNFAYKAFENDTGLDLGVVFDSYLLKSIEIQGQPLLSRHHELAKLYTRGIASRALHAIISTANDGIKLAEIEDATFLVGGVLTERPDDLSESWPLVMLDAAHKIFEYSNANMPVKKKEGTEGS